MDSSMNVTELLEHFDRISSEARVLLARKNHDYAGPGGLSPFRNFTKCEDFGVTSTEKGIIVRMIDKLSRLCTYTEATEMKGSDEKFEDTIVDMINYCVILSAYLSKSNEE